MRGPGIEPGSTAWKATMLTITPATLSMVKAGGGVWSSTEVLRPKFEATPPSQALKNNEAPTFLKVVIRWYSVVVSISGCDPLDPGSNPGTVIFFLF